MNEKFKQLAEINEALAELKRNKYDILPDEIKQLLFDLGLKEAELTQEKETLISQIKDETLDMGQTFKATNGMKSVYYKGRVTWDSKALEGYALAHPELNELKKVGSPTVRIVE